MKTFNNYLYNMAYQVLTLLVPLITTPYISRVLEVDGVGRYSVTQTVIEYFILFGLLGMSIYGTRQIAYVRDDKEQKEQTFWDLNYMRMITMGIATVCYFLYVFLIEENKTLYLVQSFNVFSSFIDISWYFAGIEQFRTTALRNVIVKIITVVLIFSFVKTKDDLVLYALIVSLSLFVGQAVLWINIKREVGFKKPNWKQIQFFFWGSFKLWLPTIAASVYTSLDKLMLSYYTNDIQVGLYVNSQKIVKIASTITTALSIVTIPKTSNSYSNGRIEEMSKTVYTSLSAVSFLAFPMTFGLMAVRETLVPWFLGKGYEGVVDLLLISALLIITLSWSSILANQVLVASKKENYYTVAIIIGAVVNFGLNIILIPRYKAVGALCTSVLAEYLGMFVMLFFSRKIISSKVFLKNILPYLVGGLLVYVCVYPLGGYLRTNMLSTMVQVLVGGVVYIVAMFIIKDSILLYIIDNTIRRIKVK